MSKVYIIMGVSGSGKTTIGKRLAEQFKLPYYDGDDFHSLSNINKMQEGIPLNDEDREPWLGIIAEQIKAWNSGSGAVISCSALKNSYRDLLSLKNEVQFIFLKGTFDMISKRLRSRENHFFKEGLLRSQFEILEEPENAIKVDVEQPISQIMEHLTNNLK